MLYAATLLFFLLPFSVAPFDKLRTGRAGLWGRVLRLGLIGFVLPASAKTFIFIILF